MKILPILLLIINLLHIQTALIATISCQSCSQSCITGHCLVINLGSHTFIQCTALPCTLRPYNLAFGACTYDVYGKPCSTGVCAQLGIKGCASTLLQYEDCSIDWKTISCGTCRQPQICQKCTKYQTSTTVSFQDCLGPSCNNLQPINITFIPCTNNVDSFGNPCSCCYTIPFQHPSKPGICTSQYGMLANSTFNQYVRKVWEAVVGIWGWVWVGLGVLGLGVF